jgi:hypothetical protein
MATLIWKKSVPAGDPGTAENQSASGRAVFAPVSFGSRVEEGLPRKNFAAINSAPWAGYFDSAEVRKTGGWI